MSTADAPLGQVAPSDDFDTRQWRRSEAAGRYRQVVKERVGMDYAVARQHMVDSQIRTNKVTDERLIEAIRALPRERFVPEPIRARSYVDDDVELSPGRYLMEPMVTARLIQAADVKPTDMVLVVGAASGYSSALLAKLANAV